MSQQAQFFPLSGGLDIITAAIAARPGTARAALNYESDNNGYRRVSGYERYDGRVSPTDAYDAAADIVTGALDRETARAAITPIPGSGPTRGIWYYNGSLYGFRDTEDGENGQMYRASPDGWVLMSAAFPPGGRYDFVNYNFTGAAAEVMMYGVNGVGKAFQYDGDDVTFITTGMAADTPFKIEAHKRHLFLAFGGGSIQHSALGDPLSWTAVTGALELAIGDEVTDLVSAAPANMVVLSKNGVSLLYGNDSSDWQLETVTTEAGALPHSAQKLGPVMYMDNRGLRSLTTTAAFGNFNIGTMTQFVAPLLRAKLSNGQLPVASCRVRGRDTYRVFFADGFGFSVYVGRKQPEVMPVDLGVAITCICSAETLDNVEVIWFGDANGMVYQMDKGRSYDGASLNYHLRLPFNHMGGPQMLKRWHKAVLDFDSNGPTAFRIAGEVDYGDAKEVSLVDQNIPASGGGGGFWDAVNWDQFVWSAPAEGRQDIWVDAIGQNMSLLIGGEEADEEPHTLQGLTLFFSVKGTKR